MNITIYYLSKKITLHKKNQSSENQLFKDIDLLKKQELLNAFELFINQNNIQELHFKTDSPEDALNKFKKIFKYIVAAGGLIEKGGKYLFIFRFKKWDLPKGKLDEGEKPEEAAIRECEEECGVSELKIKNALEPTYHIYDYEGGYAIKKTYWYAMTTTYNKTLVPQTEENIEIVDWFTPKQIKETLISNSYPAILDVIRHIL